MTTKTESRPLFPYPGSKWHLMKKIIPLFPEHRHYVSVFGGSGTDLLRKEPSHVETFNDIEGNICNLFEVLRDEELCKKLTNLTSNTPSSCDRTYKNVCQILKNGSKDKVILAWAFLVVAFQGRCEFAPGRKAASNKSVNKLEPRHKRWLSVETRIAFAKERFRQVQVMERGWKYMIEQFDKSDTLFFVDPPYLPETIVTQLYQTVMSVNEHEEMLESLNSIKGKAILCGYPSKLYDQTLVGWHRQEFSCPAHLSSKKKKPKRREVLWMNFRKEA